MATSMVTCLCDQCGKEFERTIADMNKRKKHGVTKSFCTQRCYLLSRGTRTTLTCNQCHKPFDRKPSEAKKYVMAFCSRDCYLQFNRPKYVTHQCHGCGKTFERSEAQERAQRKEGLNRSFCSFDCYKEHFSNRFEVTCDHCGKHFEKQGKAMTGKNRHFCTRACWLLANAAPPIIRHCEVCDAEIEEPAWYRGFAMRHNRPVTQRKFCSMQCTGAGKLAPEARLEYSREFRKTIRLVVRERDDNVCQECGASETKRAHDVHHIDYNKKNDDLSNLITLCQRCHTKTTGAGPTARKRWIDYYQKKMATLIQ